MHVNCAAPLVSDRRRWLCGVVKSGAIRGVCIAGAAWVEFLDDHGVLNVLKGVRTFFHPNRRLTAVSQEG